MDVPDTFTMVVHLADIGIDEVEARTVFVVGGLPTILIEMDSASTGPDNLRFLVHAYPFESPNELADVLEGFATFLRHGVILPDVDVED